MDNKSKKKKRKNEKPIGLLVCFALVGILILGVSLKNDDTESTKSKTIITEKQDESYAPNPKTTSDKSVKNTKTSANITVTDKQVTDKNTETSSTKKTVTTKKIVKPNEIVIPDTAMPTYLPQKTDSFPSDIDPDFYLDIVNNKVKPVLQNPTLPTGCEITALTALLNYHGFEVSKTIMANNFLPQAPAGESDFDNAFIGNPYDYTGYGCFPPVIKYSAERFLEAQNSSLQVYNLTGTYFYNLLSLVSEGYPVLCWVSGSLKPFVDVGVLWTYDGKDVDWLQNEHCMVLTGYDYNNSIVYVMDPLQGNTSYDLDLFAQRYSELGEKSVLIK